MLLSFIEHVPAILTGLGTVISAAAGCSWMVNFFQKRKEKEPEPTPPTPNGNADDESIFDSPFLSNLPLSGWIKSLDGKYLKANFSYGENFSISPEFIRGKTDYEIFDTETAKQFRTNDAIVVQQKSVLETTERFPLYRNHPEQGSSPWRVIKFPIYGPDKEILYIGNIARPILATNNWLKNTIEVDPGDIEGTLKGVASMLQSLANEVGYDNCYSMDLTFLTGNTITIPLIEDVWISVLHGVRLMLWKSSPKETIVFLEVNYASVLPCHTHSRNEHVEVIKGYIIDQDSGIRYNVGDHWCIPAGEKHCPLFGTGLAILTLTPGLDTVAKVGLNLEHITDVLL